MPRRKKKDDLFGPVIGLAFLLFWVYPILAQNLIYLGIAAVLAGGMAWLLFLIWKGKPAIDLSARHTYEVLNEENTGVQNSRSGAGQLETAFKNKILKTENLIVSDGKWSINLLKKLEWKRFEEICAAYFEMVVFGTRLQRCGADGGVDIHLYWGESSAPVAIVQCKAWNAYQVGVKPIRELYGVMVSDRAKEAFFITSGDYTREAIEFAEDKNLTLVTGVELLRRIGELTEDQQEKLLEIATQGDYTTPTCTSCGIKMVSRHGKNGEMFWGCVNFPRCRRTLRQRSIDQ